MMEMKVCMAQILLYGFKADSFLTIVYMSWSLLFVSVVFNAVNN